MADADVDVSVDTQEDAKVVEQKAANPTVELEAKIAKLSRDLENARKSEKFAKSTKEELAARVTELEAQGEWKNKYEFAVEQLKNITLDTCLK